MSPLRGTFLIEQSGQSCNWIHCILALACLLFHFCNIQLCICFQGCFLIEFYLLYRSSKFDASTSSLSWGCEKRPTTTSNISWSERFLSQLWRGFRLWEKATPHWQLWPRTMLHLHVQQRALQPMHLWRWETLWTNPFPTVAWLRINELHIWEFFLQNPQKSRDQFVCFRAKILLQNFAVGRA